jgi:hypothetical protein
MRCGNKNEDWSERKSIKLNIKELEIPPMFMTNVLHIWLNNSSSFAKKFIMMIKVNSDLAAHISYKISLVDFCSVMLILNYKFPKLLEMNALKCLKVHEKECTM